MGGSHQLGEGIVPAPTIGVNSFSIVPLLCHPFLYLPLCLPIFPLPYLSFSSYFGFILLFMSYYISGFPFQYFSISVPKFYILYLVFRFYTFLLLCLNFISYICFSISFLSIVPSLILSSLLMSMLNFLYLRYLFGYYLPFYTFL